MIKLWIFYSIGINISVYNSRNKWDNSQLVRFANKAACSAFFVWKNGIVLSVTQPRTWTHEFYYHSYFD